VKKEARLTKTGSHEEVVNKPTSFLTRELEEINNIDGKKRE